MVPRKKKILIIEDDEHISKIYELKFANEGYVTSLAMNGIDGIARLRAEKPDLVILDIMLPQEDGFFVLEEIKKDNSLSSVPVLVISNLGQKSDQDRALGLGAKEYLVKVEYSMQEVMDKVKAYLQ